MSSWVLIIVIGSWGNGARGITNIEGFKNQSSCEAAKREIKNTKQPFELLKCIEVK